MTNPPENKLYKCPHCNKLCCRTGHRFCPRCGGHLGDDCNNHCNQCGTELISSYKYCPSCGRELDPPNGEIKR